MEDLQIVELVVRKDPKVIEQCGIIGIPPEDMHKVYCDREFSDFLHSLGPFTSLMFCSMDYWI
jgi:Cu2+-containing amine oxidase